jgi:hypothetical protein
VSSSDQLVVNTLPSYTSISNAAVGNTIYNQDVSHRFYASSDTIAAEISILYSIKVKVTLVQALRLCTGRTAHKGSRGIALSFHDHGTRRG